MIITIPSLMLLAAAPASDATAVLLTTPTAEPHRHEAKLRELRAAGTTVIAGGAVIEGLGGKPAVTVEPSNLQADLEHARQLDANWQSEEASAVRERMLAAVLHACPSTAAAAIASAASHEHAALLLAEKGRDVALGAAQQSLRWFGEIPLDSTRLPPDARRLFEEAKRAQPRPVPVTVRTTAPAVLHVNARQLGAVQEATTVQLVPGTYFVCLQDPVRRTRSLVHEVVVGSEAIAITIDFELESRIGLEGERAVLDCVACTPMLDRVRRALGADTAFLMLAPDSGQDHLRVPAPSTPAATSPLPPEAQVMATDARPRFHPLYLVPFGGAQLAQERWAFGASYLAVSAGLAAWQIFAQVELARAVSEVRVRVANDMLFQANLSLGLLIGAGVLTIAEAVIVGLVSDD